MLRIRYDKTDPDNQFSTVKIPIQASDDLISTLQNAGLKVKRTVYVLIYINIVANEFELLAQDANKVVSFYKDSGSESGDKVYKEKFLKNKAKRALQKYGVRFFKENRKA